MKYKAVLFDMDGTVLDTLTDLYDSVNHSLRHFGLPPASRETVRAGLGSGAEHLLRCCMPGQPEETLRAVLAHYLPWYDAHCRIETRPYEGVLPLMERLRAQGVRLAIISNKPDPAVQELAEAFFPGLLETAVGESAAVRRKPDPDAVLAAAARMGLPARACVYVGDSEVDLETARRAGMDCISVAWGFRDEDQLLAAGAAHVAHDCAELETLL
ncbi:MAG: HAD family hydrolase [Oscillospiraceae bacterium]|nr:HAD family hydrolase [Oscillospiraceae bacterium]